MQFIVDFLPLILFFVAFKWQGIYFATAVAIAASIVQILWLHFRRGKVGVVNWLSLAIIVVFGGATLLLQDEQFIKWKPSVLYGLFGTVLAVGRIGFGRNLIASLMPGITLPGPVYTRLTWAWVAFFAFMGVANWYVAFHYPTETWVNFKVWGGMGLFLLFALAQGIALSRYAHEEAS
jgi:intracellular septation protein